MTNTLRKKTRVKDLPLKGAVLGVLLLLLLSCGGSGGEVCECLPGTANLTVVGTGIQKQNSSSTVSMIGGTVTLTKAFLSLSKIHFLQNGEVSGEESFRSPFLLDIIQSDPEVPETANTSVGEVTLKSLQFRINDLDDRNHDGIVDGDQQPVNITIIDSGLVGKSILLQGSINTEGQPPINFTFTTDLTVRVLIPFVNPVPVVTGQRASFLLAVDLAKMFNSIDTDPTKTSVIELRDAATISGGVLDPKVANGAETIAQAIEGAISKSLNLFIDNNGNGLPDPGELIGDESLMTITPVSD